MKAVYANDGEYARIEGEVSDGPLAGFVSHEGWYGWGFVLCIGPATWTERERMLFAKRIAEFTNTDQVCRELLGFTPEADPYAEQAIQETGNPVG